VAVVFEDVEVKHRAVACRQSAHHFVDGVGWNVADGRVVRLWLVGNVVTEWSKLMPLVASQEFQRLVDDHPCGPSRQGACPAILEIADVGEDVNESVLKHILLIVLIDDVSGADACQVVGIQGIELPGGTLFAVLQALDQSLFLCPYRIHPLLIARIYSDKVDGTRRLFANDIKERVVGVERYILVVQRLL